jgi:hypothetical protein
MSETEILFVDAPPPQQRRGRPSPITPWLAALREHPGRWAEYPQSILNYAAATNIKRGKGYGVKPGEFETTARRTEDGKAFRLFARYVGGES